MNIHYSERRKQRRNGHGWSGEKKIVIVLYCTSYKNCDRNFEWLWLNSHRVIPSPREQIPLAREASYNI